MSKRHRQNRTLIDADELVNALKQGASPMGAYNNYGANAPQMAAPQGNMMASNPQNTINALSSLINGQNGAMAANNGMPPAANAMPAMNGAMPPMGGALSPTGNALPPMPGVSGGMPSMGGGMPPIPGMPAMPGSGKNSNQNNANSGSKNNAGMDREVLRKLLTEIIDILKEDIKKD